MASWLRNLQGQVTDIMTEVLNEAAEEVSDPAAELQVAKKKLTETEQELLAAKESADRLQKRIADLENELYAKTLEVDALNVKCASIVDSRNDQIRSLQTELERVRHLTECIDAISDEDDGPFSEGNMRLARMKDELEQLKKECAHWKRIVNEENEEGLIAKIAELEKSLTEQKSKHENAVAALINNNNESINQLRTMYEKKISKLETELERVRRLTECIDAVSDEDDGPFSEGKTRLTCMKDEHYPQTASSNNQVESLKEQIRALECEGESSRAEVETLLSANEKKLAEVDELALKAVDKVLSNRIYEGEEMLRKEVEKLNAENACSQNLNKHLQEELVKAHELIDAQREKYEREIEHLKKQFERENEELAAAYNDLNEEYEQHKAELGSVLTSNRDLNARIDALKASLIEYDERYEMCKNENMETVQQLEKLSNDFEQLRKSFEKSKTWGAAADAINEVQRLRDELDASKDDREKLRGDVERFLSAIGTIDSELDKLRESNDRLVRENEAMGASLNRFAEIRDMLANSNSELQSLREKFMNLQEEYQMKENEWQTQLLVLKTARDDAERQLEQKKRMTFVRNRVSGETIGAEIVELKGDGGKATSSEGTVDSNGGWENMTDWDTTVATNEAACQTDGSAVSDSHSGCHYNTTVMDELREALAMITEKTEECEELRRQKCEFEKELELRQTCIDELMSQLNVLQSQQNIEAQSFTQLRDWAKQKEQETLKMERMLVRAENELKFMKEDCSKLREINEIMEEELKRANAGGCTVDAFTQVCMEEVTSQADDWQDDLHAKNLEISSLKTCKDKLTNENVRLKDEKLELEKANILFKEEFKQIMEGHQNDKALAVEKMKAEMEDELKQANARLEESEAVRQSLIELVEQKHAESVIYHGQLQAYLGEREQLFLTQQKEVDRAKALEDELKTSKAAHVKAAKECDRLREHLLIIEETSTRESIAAEEREAELRHRIRMLEEKTEKSADSVIESANAYEQQICELADELDELKKEKVELVEHLENKEKMLADTCMTMSNLQRALRGVTADHNAKVAQYEKDIATLKKEIENQQEVVHISKNNEEKLLIEKQVLEDDMARMRDELKKQYQLVEDLEANLEEKTNQAGPSSSNKIDDQVLRQLFMSYFTAEKDKQPEIAQLLTSVLGYSQEEISKINATQQASRGWFGFGSSPRLSIPDTSFSEQFVRFLEKESVTFSTSHTLPVQPSEEKETMRSSSMPPQQSRRSSTTDLRSILDT